MRYESKHAYFKNILRTTKNFINLPWTLGYRHQQWMCQKTVSNFLFETEFKGSKCTFISMDTLRESYRWQVAEALNMSHPLPFVKRLNWLRINSTTYKVNESVLLCPLRGSRQAQFGLLVDIISYQNRFLFVCHMMTTKLFNHHYQSYKVSLNDFFYVLEPKHLCNSLTYAAHKPSFTRCRSEDMYVVTKTEVWNNLLLVQ